jgi:hypothetical protein
MITDTFTINLNSNEVEFLIKSPSLTEQREAQKVYNQAFSDAVKSGCIVRGRLEDLLKEQGLWDDNKQLRMTTLQQEILDGEKTLAKGGISLNAAKQIAMKMKSLREDLRDLISVRTNLDNHTAEGQADNARFNYLVSCCLVYKDSKKKYFDNYEDYLNRASEPTAIRAAQVLANMLYGLDNDYEKKLPENKFLLKYKLVDNNLRFINKDGKLVDSDGRLVDENGRYINDKGQFVDKNGNLVDDNGEYVTDFKPFTDDSGNPILLENENDTKTNEVPSHPPTPLPIPTPLPQEVEPEKPQRVE